MEFDVVLGNPPYQGSDNKRWVLWMKFVDRAFTLVRRDGWVALVTPAAWLSPNAAFEAITANDVRWVDLTAAKHFPGVGSTFSAWVAQARRGKQSATFVTENGTHQIDWSGMSFLPAEVTPTTMSLTRKFFFGEHPRFTFDHNYENPTDAASISETRSAQFKYRVFHTNAQAELWSPIKNSNYDAPKVVMTLSGYQIPYYLPNCGTTRIGYYITVKSAAEGQRVVKILSSKLYQGMMNLCKYAGFGLARVITQLPAVARDRDWTDEDLYAHFGLTKAEIAYIEEHAK